jgi:hypothetical protein
VRGSLSPVRDVSSSYRLLPVRKAVLGMMAMKRMSTLAHHLTPEHRALEQDLFKYKQESEKVCLVLFNFSITIR